MASQPAAKLTLLTGASGYIGGELLSELQRRGERVRCLARHPESLRARIQAGTQGVRGDVLDPRSLDRGLAGGPTARYLVHSLGAGPPLPPRRPAPAPHLPEAPPPAPRPP